MKTTIVITTINPPTEAVEKFAAMSDYNLVIVGDKKTPAGWQCKNAIFLGADDMATNYFSLSAVLPYNHYCRKMLGYLFAIKGGADAIVDTDDDNIPNEDWAFPGFTGKFDLIKEEGFVNIYKLFTDQHIWPRGLPLSLINDRSPVAVQHNTEATIGMWQGLADEDPDVDAIYRLTNNQPCYFKRREPVVLGFKTIVPFNTQNTLVRKELFALMYLPTYVTFRFTDILRGLVAQPIMALYGYQLGFTDATVIQKRNPHDFYKDFISEIPMYEHCERAVEITRAAISAEKSISENLSNAYKALKEHRIVEERELVTLDAWLSDLSGLNGK